MDFINTVKGIKIASIRKIFLLNLNDPRNTEQYSGISMMQLERERHVIYHRFRIHPHSRFRISWETFYCLFIYINVTVTYIFLSMITVNKSLKNELSVMPVTDIIIVVNVFLNLITGTYDEDRKEVNMNSFVIWKEYLSTGMLVFDAIGLILGSPLIFFYFLIPENGGYEVDFIFLFNVMAVLCRTYSALYYWRNSVSKYFMLDGLSSRFIELFFYFPLVISLLSFTVFTIINRNDGLKLIGKGLFVVFQEYYRLFYRIWVSAPCIQVIKNPFDLLVNSCSVVIPYIRFFIIASFLILIYCANRGANISYNDLTDNFNHYLQRVEISNRLRKRIGKYYEETYNGGFYSEPYILEKVSSELREDILSLKLSRLREQIDVFKMIPLVELVVISQLLVCEVYFGNDVIAYSGTHSDRMYFIARGAVAVYTNNAYEAYHVPNSMFILIGGIRPKLTLTNFNYLACETTMLYALSRWDFIPVKNQCPKFTELLWFTYDVLHDSSEFIQKKDIELNNQENE